MSKKDHVIFDDVNAFHINIIGKDLVEELGQIIEEGCGTQVAALGKFAPNCIQAEFGNL